MDQLKKHWERAAFAAVVAIFVAVAALGATRRVGEIDAAESVVRRIDPNRSNPAVGKPPRVSPVLAEIEPVRPVKAPASAILSEPPPPPPPPARKDRVEFTVLGVQLAAPVVLLEGIDLALTVEEKPKRADKLREYFAPRQFVIERRSGGTWEKIATTSALRHLDATVKPKTDYHYRATPVCDDPRFVPTASNEVAARSMPRWEFAFKSPAAATVDGRPATVSIEITVNDPEAGRMSISRIHTAGSPIGLWQDIGDKAPTYLHSIFSPRLKRNVMIDFDCKCELRTITFDKTIEHAFERCNVEKTFRGPKCNGIEKVPAPFKRTEILYVDDEKRPVMVHFDGVKLTGTFCPEHAVKK